MLRVAVQPWTRPNNADRTLIDRVARYAQQCPNAPALSLLSDAGAIQVQLTYRDLARRVGGLACQLRACTNAGDRAVLVYSDGIQFALAMLACFAAGVIAVPAYPPGRTGAERGLRRLRGIVGAARASHILCDNAVGQRKERYLERAPELAALEWFPTEAAEQPPSSELWARRAAGHELAFLQFTSGSTADPKGVAISHDNLMHNERLLQLHFELPEEPCIVVSWLPPYHDMGLVGAILHPLFTGGHCYLMSPSCFAKRPASWLEAMSRFGANTTAAPDFAYALCAREAGEEAVATLDLSRVKIAISGGEPIRPETMRAFSAAFARSGFDARAFRPCYGLAESTLIVSAGGRDQLPITQTFNRVALTRGVVLQQAASPETVELASCGTWLAEVDLKVVHPELQREVGATQVGEIWLKGPSIAARYYGNEDATKSSFGLLLDGTEGGYFRTGDLGFVFRGQLFVTGRLKDLIIHSGRNYYAEDIERSVEAAGLSVQRPVAVFSLARDGLEELVVVAEPRHAFTQDLVRLQQDIGQAVYREHGLPVEQVVLARRGEIPKTSSGKVRRQTCKQMLLDGLLTRAKEGSR